MGQAITLSGLQPAGQTFSYIFRGPSESHVVGALQVAQYRRGQIELSQSNLEIGQPPPQADIDASRPVMALIDSRLKLECGLSMQPNTFKEWCSGVKCGGQ